MRTYLCYQQTNVLITVQICNRVVQSYSCEYAHLDQWLRQVYRNLVPTDHHIQYIHEITCTAPEVVWKHYCGMILQYVVANFTEEQTHVLCSAASTPSPLQIEDWVRTMARQIAPSGHRINGLTYPMNQEYQTYLLSSASRCLSGAFFDHHGCMIRGGDEIAEQLIAQRWGTKLNHHTSN
jgi:hypothetical protein